jgi:LacI family transcriptional regulator/LacI family purine nucleotide synthesis repressor/LacI family repressor for deo operon, udp, cdd, tsx, nupC, and nupG
MEKKTVTVYDIAKEAGVSPATVSRVLTGNASVKEEKRKKVIELIEKYNFQPNALARGLFKKETKTIGIILPDVRNPFFSTVYLMADKAALNKGYTMMLCNSMSNSELESKYLTSLSEKQVDAMIFVGGRVNDININEDAIKELQLISSRMPLVVINGIVEGLDCCKITTEEDKGIEGLVDYLVSLGHTNIGIIGGELNITSTIIKHKALEKALSKHGMKFNRDWMIMGGYSIEVGTELIKEMMIKESKPTAIIAINDFVAVGAIKGAKELGVKVPEDISITGFDDTYLSEIISPQLTTVSHNYELIGESVIELIINALSKKEFKKAISIPTKLVTRESCYKVY